MEEIREVLHFENGIKHKISIPHNYCEVSACVICWKKVLMENPLNVLSRNLGDFGGILQRFRPICVLHDMAA